MLIKCGGKDATSLTRNFIPMTDQPAFGDIRVGNVLFYGANWMDILNYLARYSKVKMNATGCTFQVWAGKFLTNRVGKLHAKEFSHHDYKGPVNAMGTVLVMGGLGTLIQLAMCKNGRYLGVSTTGKEKMVKHEKSRTHIASFKDSVTLGALRTPLKRGMGMDDKGKSHRHEGAFLGDVKDAAVDGVMGVGNFL